VRSARAVGEPVSSPVTADPLRRRLPGAADQTRRSRDRHPGDHKTDQPLSLAKTESSITMNKQEPSFVVRLRQAAH
jgi:hypothetical protein